MDSPALALAIGSAVLVVGVWVQYLSTVPSGRVPVRPIGGILGQILGTSMAIVAIIWWVREGGAHAAAVIAPASLALTMGALFLWILTQRKTPIGDIKVAVGDSILPFSARTADGEPFSSDSFAGKRVLLKFFRGSW